MMTSQSLATICASALICVVALPAHAERFRVGRLLCASTPRIGQVFGSAQDLRCVFRAGKLAAGVRL
jgi:hypothetical protein